MCVDTEAASANAASEDLADHLDWLRAFKARHGRPLRVLHVGNIANNAYLNAKFLRSVGVDAHVLCHDYQHVMATPEWEEVELVHGHGHDFAPVFSRRDLGGYQRPTWFVSGSLVSCASRMAMLWGEGSPSKRRAWLPVVRRTWLSMVERVATLATRAFGILPGYAVRLALTNPHLFLLKFTRFVMSRLSRRRSASPAITNLGERIHHTVQRALIGDSAEIQCARIVSQFDLAFPNRADQLTVEEVAPYHAISGLFSAMFRHYDIVQCYAVDPIHALIADKRPYVAFEHGTLRDFTMGDVPLHRLTALAYRRADHTFITNGDCLAHAQRLGMESFSPIIHPVDVEQHRRDFGDDIEALRSEIGGEVILFCPVRHDWEIKGTDVHLRAFPLIKERVQRSVKLVLIAWGLQLADSKALLRDLGCDGDVVWRPSMCRIAMIKHLRAADVVLDQMALPHFGATAPQAIAVGTPVISSYVPESTSWIIPEPAPILPAFSSEEVADAVIRALKPDWRANYERRARHWINTYHHPDKVIFEHLRIYRKLLEHERRSDQTETPL